MIEPGSFDFFNALATDGKKFYILREKRFENMKRFDNRRLKIGMIEFRISWRESWKESQKGFKRIHIFS